MDERNELVQDFLVESYENLDSLDQNLVALEGDPKSQELLAGIFRTIHTIKGSCGFLGFKKLEGVTHAGETLLSKLRDGELELDGSLTSVMLKLVDVVRESLAVIEHEADEGKDSYEDLKELLARMLPGNRATLGLPGQPTLEELMSAAGIIAADGDAALAAPAKPRAVASQEEEPDAGGSSSFKGSRVAGSHIRVQVDQLDKLMNQVGELVLARNQILQGTSSSEDTGMIATAQRLNLITSELQEGIMKIRMQPIGNLWSKIPRVVRDIARVCGKEVAVRMIGKETELDKTLLEAVLDPLTHVVRNSIDHGIESPKERLAAGKPAQGVITLRAYHESGQVNIQISDDGRGLDPVRIKEIALSKGVVSPDSAAAMSERDLIRLIFRPGVSTAEAVTNLSGRGVGMDVVKTNIEKIGGTVELESEFRSGTTIQIRIPLTLAIIPALIVSTDGARYAIPQVNLVELVLLDGQDAESRIEDLHGIQVYRLRGNLLPLCFLRKTLQLRERESAREGEEERQLNIVVLQAGQQQFGLVVDKINDTEEIVVKPLEKQLKGITAYAGTTIMGDGRVALILDTTGLARMAGVISSEVCDQEAEKETALCEVVKSTQAFMVLRAAERRYAIRLESVDRLEEIQVAAIERSGDSEVVQYRGHIMPLVRVAEVLGQGSTREPSDGVYQVVVHSKGTCSFGIVVDDIMDIVEEGVELSTHLARSGIIGSMVLAGKVTDLLDLDGLLPHPEGAAGDAMQSRASAIEETRAKTRQLCTFSVDGLFFGVDVQKVQEVLRFQEMTDVPLTSDAVRGLINLRGQNVMALDLRERLGLGPSPDFRLMKPEELPMNVVLRTEDSTVSILVDSVGDVLEVAEADRAPVPNTLERSAREMLTDVYKLPGRLLLLLDIERILDVDLALVGAH